MHKSVFCSLKEIKTFITFTPSVNLWQLYISICSEHSGGDKGIHDRDVELLEQSDVIVAEVTQPSLGVGYELGRAVAMAKPILCLYRPQVNINILQKSTFFSA